MKKKKVFQFIFILSLFLITGFIVAQDSPDDLTNCDAYFEGYKFNGAGCTLVSASGCVDPFEYKTKESCEAAHSVDSDEDRDSLKGDSETVEAGESESCIDKCKGICPDENCRSECINKCKLNSGFDVGNFKYEKSSEEDTLSNEELKNSYSGDEKDIFKGYDDEVIKESAGITPDSAFYFLDKFFDRFGDELKVREERMAEFKQMIEEGNIESARSALEEYKLIADNLEKEVDPSKRDEALRSAAAIRNAMRDIQDKVPSGERDEFVHDVIERERSIATAAEIARKIRDLCRELADLDPTLFYQSCKTGDEGPKWQKDMYKEMSEKQKVEAKKFAQIMKQCFKSSGQECKCEEIPFPEFAQTCSIAAPLATACEVKRDESACKELDNLKMPLLPPHLRDIMDDLESGMMYEKYDMHLPPECQEVGATTPKECSRIMIESNAPPECKEALLKADVKNEKEGRIICDGIMMQKHAPECAEQGITDPEKCKDFMWNINNRPEECRKNKIHDFNDCKNFLEGGGNRDIGGPMINFDCKSITNSNERLKCFDEASSGFGNFEQNFKDIKEKERSCAERCHSEGKAWDFTGGNCQCREGPAFKNERGEWRGYDCNIMKCGQGSHCEPDFGCVSDGGDKRNYVESECKDGCNDECPNADRTNCVNGRCECYYDTKEYNKPEYNRDDDSTGSEYVPETDSNEIEEDYSERSSKGGDSGVSESSSSSSEVSSGDTSSSSGDESSSSSEGGYSDAGITGNAFLEYYYR